MKKIWYLKLQSIDVPDNATEKDIDSMLKISSINGKCLCWSINEDEILNYVYNKTKI